MSKTRLIERLKWYYPLEKFHTFVTVPILLLYLLFTNPLSNLVFISYGLIICIVILYQGQLYWKLKLQRLTGKNVNQEKNLQFFRKFKRINWLLILFMLPALLIQLYLQNWDFKANDMLFWGVLANVFAILEHVNYYYVQLMIDNKYDVHYLLKNKRLKTASLSKDLVENRI
ncbi:hypothetical protein O4H26_14675 [Aequorivita viscosa]|nr:hypothetical protein [Aequorivita viscosa]